MLQAIKSKTGTWVLRIFAVLLIMSFAVWGIGDMITGTGLPTEVADVGDTKVTANQFNEAFRREMNRLRGVLGSRMDSDQARQLGVADSTLEGLITQRLLALEARDLGLLVGDDQIKQTILRQTAFRNQLGNFDQAVYRQVLSQSGLTEDRYVEGLRGDITQSHLTDVIGKGSFVPKFLVDQLYRFRNERRIAEVVVIDRDKSGAPPKPSDSELREFHKKNAALFTAPELRDITTLHLSPNKLAEEIKPSDEQLRDEYENRLTSLSIPERRQLRQILTQDEATANRAAGRLRQGAPIADVAKEVANQDEDATRLGLVTFNDLPKEMAEAAFKLAENTASDPVKSPLGWHVLLVEKINAGKTPAFEDVREKISTDLARELAIDGLVKIANQLEDALAGGASLEEAAGQLNAPVIRLSAVSANGRDGDGKEVPKLPRVERFLETAFTTEKDQTSDLIETDSGHYFIVRVENIQAPALKPYETVRDQVERQWVLSGKDETARKKAEAILARVRAGASLTSVATKDRLKIETSKEFTRFNRAAGSKISAAMAGELFRVPRGGVAMAPSRSGYAVAQVKDIRAAEPSSNKEAYDRVRDQIQEAMGDDVLSQFSTALRDRFPVSIDRGALDRLFNATAGSP